MDWDARPQRQNNERKLLLFKERGRSSSARCEHWNSHGDLFGGAIRG